MTFRFGGIVPLYSTATRKTDCLTALCLCSAKFLLEVYHAIFRREVFHGRKYDSRLGLAARRHHGEVQDCGFPSGQQPRLVHFHRPLDVGLHSSWQLHPEAQDTGLPGECQPRHECHHRVFGVRNATTPFVTTRKEKDASTLARHVNSRLPGVW